MKTITKPYNVYTYTELEDKAKALDEKYKSVLDEAIINLNVLNM